MQFTVHTAKSQLSKLIEAAMAGEEVIIAKGSKPMVRLVPVHQGGFRFGTLQSQLAGTDPDFTALPDDELALWEGRE